MADTGRMFDAKVKQCIRHYDSSGGAPLIGTPFFIVDVGASDVSIKIWNLAGGGMHCI
ncbi:hypothetical protein Q5Y75_16940 [Ruegeria sp. 2205SS24-7]|uniref:hypothetical protein n=1 Tax=Ruegeria discodermiae TaxID=3064389 RepID=UPI0027429BD9|nr:hypothetical protein [Ruegeria sp. 2205SS24-7]MDP5218909.1 hypothetical protein [Ruegeria sp. 2205SS24-7]